MLFITTKKNTETGKYLSKILKKIDKSNALAKELVSQLGAERHVHHLFNELLISPFCGVAGFIFKNKSNPNPDLLIKANHRFIKNLYFPNHTTKEGKLLVKKMNKIPIVNSGDLNVLITYHPIEEYGYGCVISFIAYNLKDDIIGFVVDDERIPPQFQTRKFSDCNEVSKKTFKGLFNITKLPQIKK